MRSRPEEGDHPRTEFFRRVGLTDHRKIRASIDHSKEVLHGPALASERLEPDGGTDDWLRSASRGDGILLDDPKTAAWVTVADCMPIWLHERITGRFGVLHSGWRGTGILSNAIRIMTDGFRTDPANISIILGPAIGSCCYVVDGQRAGAFMAEFGDDTAVFRDGTWRLDLRRANEGLGRRAGVGSIASVPLCTCCDGRFGSYRRQGADFTRMAAVIARVRESTA